MLNYIKKSFELTNKYIILATPLILFSLISSLYILFSVRENLINLLITFVLFVLMLAAFLSGWSYMLKLCVAEHNIEEPNALIKEFPAGVGEYFFLFLGLLFNVFVISCLLIAAVYFIGIKYIGDVGISAGAFSDALQSIESLKTFLTSLSREQILKLNLWNILIMVSMGVEYFLLLFYLPALSFKSRNPFKALGKSLKDLFSMAFFKNVGLYVVLFFSYSILSVLTSIFGFNDIMHFIFTLVNFYYMVFIAVYVYHYYYENFIKAGGKFDQMV